MQKILLVDDSLEILQAVRELLNTDYEVTEANNAGDGIQLLSSQEYDVVILDWQLPDKSGIEILQWYRKNGGTGRVIMLTGRSDFQDKEMGLDCGADDYLTKPFDARELLARVRAVLRRSTVLTQNTVKVGDLQLFEGSFSVRKGEQEIELNKQEFKILEFFMRNPNRVYNEDAIINRIWPDADATSDTLRSALKRLRKKVDPDGALIKNIRGVGYMLKNPT